jgi:hypothetical protein
MQSIKDWAALGSIKNVLQFLGFAEKRQECLAVLGLRGLLLPLYSRLLQSGKAADGADGV